MFRTSTIVLIGLVLAACSSQQAKQSAKIAQALMGYTPPPQEVSVLDELRAEYKKCVQLEGDPDCAQKAYDRVRDIKGLDPKPLPKGHVIITREDEDAAADGDGD